jgi:hypothetical protein
MPCSRYLGIRAVAAPTWDRHSKVAAAVNLVAPTVRMPDARVPEAAAGVKDAAQIGRQLTFCPGTSHPVRSGRSQPISFPGSSR